MQWELHDDRYRKHSAIIRRMKYYEIVRYIHGCPYKNSYMFLVKSLPRNNSSFIDRIRKMSDELQSYIIL